jgi:tRNA 2-thiouridine synthesizing protein A
MAGHQDTADGAAGVTPANPVRRLDTSGLTCPLPVLKARKLLMGMRPGEVLEVVTTDPMSVVDMPVFCAQAGHIIVHEEKQDIRFVYAIERGNR